MPKMLKTAKERKRGAACDCVEKINEQLLDHNTRIRSLHILSLSDCENSWMAIAVETEKVDRKKRAPKKIMLCVYCPFCGKRYN